MQEFTPYLPGILAAYAILLIGASSPGPAVAMLLGIANRQGRNAALITTLGIAFGSSSINILTLAGVGLLLSEAAWAMSILRAIGAAYLVWLAYGAFRKAMDPPQIDDTSALIPSAQAQFMTGYLLQVTNPKAIAFWLAIASIAPVKGAGFAVIAAFVVGAWLLSLLCHAAWAVALSASPVRALYAKGRRWIEAMLGTFFLFAAFKLATSER